MRNTISLYRRNRGAALVAALLMITFVSMGFAIWVTVIGQHAHNGEFDAARIQRHVAIWNGKYISREYALQRMVCYDSDAGATVGAPAFESAPFTGNGTVTFPAWPVAPSTSPSVFFQNSGVRATRNLFSNTIEAPWFTRNIASVQYGNLVFNDGTGVRIAGTSTDETFYQSEVRGISPMMGGNVLVVHRPFDIGVGATFPGVAPAIFGNLVCGTNADHGRVLHLMPELPASSFAARVFNWTCPSDSPVNIRPLNTVGDVVVPSNIAWSPVTFGRIGGVPDYSGRLNVVDDPTNLGNSLKHSLLTPPAGSGRVAAATITGDVPTAPIPGITGVTHTIGVGASPTIVNCKIYDEPLANKTGPKMPHLVVTNEVTEIIFDGQLKTAMGGERATFDSGAMPRAAVGFVYTQTAGSIKKLQTIRLRKSNDIRYIIALKQERTVNGSAVNIIFEGGDGTVGNQPDWHLLLLAENTPIVFSLGAGVPSANIYGGIQTDSPITCPVNVGNAINLFPELMEASADPTVPVRTQSFGLISLAPRMAWVETFMPASFTQGGNTFVPQF